MTPAGVLNVNLEDNTHMLSLTLLGTVGVKLYCVFSTSGTYKKKKGVALYIGTGSTGMQYEHPLPISDVAHLTAKYTLAQDAAEENLGPLLQEWDL